MKRRAFCSLPLLAEDWTGLPMDWSDTRKISLSTDVYDTVVVATAIWVGSE